MTRCVRRTRAEDGSAVDSLECLLAQSSGSDFVGSSQSWQLGGSFPRDTDTPPYQCCGVATLHYYTSQRRHFPFTSPLVPTHPGRRAPLMR